MSNDELSFRLTAAMDANQVLKECLKVAVCVLKTVSQRPYLTYKNSKDADKALGFIDKHVGLKTLSENDEKNTRF